MKTIQDNKKSYADQKRLHIEDNVKENIYVKFNPKKGTMKLGTCAKFSPTFCGPFEILAK